MKNEHRGHYYLRLSLALILSVTFALIVSVVYSVDRFTQSMLHPTRKAASGDTLKAAQIPFRDVKLKTQDGLNLAAWYTPPQNGAVILVAHGYNDNRAENIYVMLAKNGYGVLAWDFRAHGDSGGETCSLGYFEQFDVEAALEYALAQKDVEHIGAWGGSMGAATVILTAAKRSEIEAVVADSAFASLEDLMKGSLPNQLLFPIMAVSGEYHTGADIESVSPVNEIGKISPRAVLIIDGVMDVSKEASSPYRLYAAANEPKDIWVVEGIPHMGMRAAFPEKYEKNVIQFFDTWLLGK